VSDAATVFVVDDDAAVRLSLRMLLESAGLEVDDYATADTFLAGCAPDACGCVITDIHMPGLNGLQLQAALEERGVRLPVIMLTGQADVPAAVQSLKAGALDFIEKPFNPEVLLAQVRRALAIDARRRAEEARDALRDTLLARLTPREREVVERVAQGQSNKVVALELDISERTVELHRSRGMKKLEVRTVAELVRLLDTARESG
jgi:RNA polymerase sigma factor (sigma-70 family)